MCLVIAYTCILWDIRRKRRRRSIAGHSRQQLQTDPGKQTALKEIVVAMVTEAVRNTIAVNPSQTVSMQGQGANIGAVIKSR